MKKSSLLNRLGRGAVAGRSDAPALTSPARRPLSWLRPLAPPTLAGPEGKVASALVATKTPAALLERIQAEVLEEVGPYGFQDGLCEDEDCWTCEHLRPEREPLPVACAAPLSMAMRAPDSFDQADVSEYCIADAAEPSSADLRAPQEGVDFSATNIQEAGVDEPDIVKTDGRRILAAGDGRLWYVDVTGEKPELRSSLALPGGWVREMFMSGDKVLMLISREDDRFRWAPSFINPADRRRHTASGRNHYRGMAVVIDISDPDRMDISETLRVSGEYVSARLVGKRVTAVFVYHTPPLPEFVFPANDSEKSLSRAAEFNRQVIRETALADWVPSYIHERGETVKEGLFIDCAFAYASQNFSGRDMVSVLTVDMTGSLDPEAVTTVMTGEQDVRASSRCIYASSRSLYVTAEQREKRAENYSTNIHKFDIAGPDRARYVASGTVDGFMLNQFAMSEHDGYLRVATTNQPAESWWDEEEENSESRVDVLAHEGCRLRVVGSVGGLGRGEQIYAVRFMGKIGYVVTFRETDPLYTIDLSDPAAPRAAGELKILGYSSYLHPLGDGLLLGVGQDANEMGWTSGTQVSVFDVSDLDNPRRTAQYTMEGASSEAERDHRAFLYWAPERLVVLPVKNRWYKESGIGAVALEISKERVQLRELLRDHTSIRQAPASLDDKVSLIRQMLRDHGFISDSALDGRPYALRYRYGLTLLRSLVVGDSLFTMSDGGLACFDLASLRETSWINFDSELASMERQEELAAS